jgi:hypothetical protein
MTTTRNAERLAREIADLRRRLEGLERSASADLRSVDGGTLTVYDEDGAVRQKVGEQADGTFTIVDLNGPPPPAPAVPIAQGRAGVAVVSSYGLRADGVADWPADFQKIEVHVSGTTGFVPSLATKVGEFARDGGSLTVALDAGTYFFVLLAVNTSGRISDPSQEVTTEVLEAATSGGSGGGVKTYHTNDEPVGLDAEDDGALWYDTDRDNLQHRWSGGLLEWVPLLVGGDALASDAVDGKTVRGAYVVGGTVEAGRSDGPRVVISEDTTYGGAVAGFYEGAKRTGAVSSWEGGVRIAGTKKAIMGAEADTTNTTAIWLDVDPATSTGYEANVRSRTGVRLSPGFGHRVKADGDLEANGLYLANRQRLQPVFGRRYLTSDQWISTSGYTRLNFTGVDENSGIRWNSGNYWEIDHEGVYLLQGSVAWTRNTRNRRWIRFESNHGTIADSIVPSGSLDANYATHTITTTYRLRPGDWIYLDAWQNSTEDLYALAMKPNGNPGLTWASITKIGE